MNRLTDLDHVIKMNEVGITISQEVRILNMDRLYLSRPPVSNTRAHVFKFYRVSS